VLSRHKQQQQQKFTGNQKNVFKVPHQKMPKLKFFPGIPRKQKVKLNSVKCCHNFSLAPSFDER
jgi:hypothetical protein